MAWRWNIYSYMLVSFIKTHKKVNTFYFLTLTQTHLHISDLKFKSFKLPVVWSQRVQKTKSRQYSVNA